MLIDSLHLENIKSYESVTVSFAEGTNAICGHNGAGKSTLIEAVGFALFGSQRVRQEQLLRSGAAYGRIEACFTSTYDGRPYYVTRELHRNGASSSNLLSVDLGVSFASGVREVQEALVPHLGLKPGVKLASLFEGVVGVPQGQLTSDFLLSPAVRKARFEELLALQEFQIAYERLASPLQYGRTCLATAETKLAILREQLQAKSELEEKLRQLEADLSAERDRLTLTEAELQEVRGKRKVMDEDEQALTKAREKLTVAQAKLDLALQELGEAKRRCQEAEAAASQAQTAHDGYQRYLELDAQAQQLEQQAHDRNQLREQQHELERDLSRLEAALESLRQRHVKALQAQDEARQLEPLAQEQAALEGTMAELQQQAAQRRALQTRRKQLEDNQKALIQQQKAVQRQAQALENAPVELERLSSDRQSLLSELAAIETRIKLLQAEHEAQQHTAEAIRRGEGRVCPACQRPFEGGDIESFLQHLQSQMHESQAQVTVLQLEHKRVQAELAQTEQRRKCAEKAVAGLHEAEAQHRAIADRLSSLAQEHKQIVLQLAPLADLDAAMAELQKRLAALDDSRSRYILALSQAREVTGLEKEIAQQTELWQHLQDQLGQLRAASLPYQGLDEQLVAVRRNREAQRPQFDAYRRFAPLAAELPAWQEERERCQRLADNAQRSLLDTRQTHQALVTAYDAMAHQALRERERRLDIDCATARNTIANLEEKRREGEQQLERLRAIERQSLELQADAARARITLDLLSFLRDAIHNAGPDIAARIRSRVSHSANAIFADIMGDYSMSLQWESDYSITLRCGLYTREFAQLSGGEQMTAALAVRLALLREISDVGVAFFDEPTVNLDEERRHSLAEQIRNIRGFEQLFVISHDDSLEGVTDNVIHVYQENGVSRIEQG
ncbi:MAG: AAA family ATPase [Anaerolineae bacterium]